MRQEAREEAETEGEDKVETGMWTMKIVKRLQPSSLNLPDFLTEIFAIFCNSQKVQEARALPSAHLPTGMHIHGSATSVEFPEQSW